MANNKLRVLQLMRLLLERTDDKNGLTAEEITRALDGMGTKVERKALYDDFETLRKFGMDIQLRKENGARYHVASREFQLPELTLLVDAVQGSKFITRQKSMTLIKKLGTLASQKEAQQLQRQVVVEGRIKTANESIYYSVDAIHEAINGNHKIAFQYFDWNVDKEKVLRHDGKVYYVSPWALMWDDENYYLIAYDSESEHIRHYRVDKMVRIRGLEKERRDGAEDFKNFDAAQYSKKTFGMFRGKDETVTLRCHNKLVGVMIDRFGDGIHPDKVDAEHFDLHVKVAVSPIFLSWFMNFGADVKILAPDSVRSRFVEMLKATLARYEE